MTVEEPCIITCPASGAVANKEQCPGIPYTPEEYAKEVRRAQPLERQGGLVQEGDVIAVVE